jgi:hypothetical protein
MNSSHEDPQHASPTSDARCQANRANAQRSTGPRTEEGKASSARNSIRHGMYSLDGAAITRGPFMEDPAVVEAFLEGVVQALNPTDALQEAMANRIARLLLRHSRIDIFETNALNGADRMSLAERQVFGDEDWLLSQMELAEQMSNWLDAHYKPDAARWTKTTASHEAEADPDFYQNFAEFWRHVRGEVRVDGLWDVQKKPSTHEEWRRVFVALVTTAFDRPASMELWLTERRRAWFAEYLQVQGRRAEAVAKRSVKELERTTNLHGSVGRQLARELISYRLLQAASDQEDDGS